jgi:hypothetical protein
VERERRRKLADEYLKKRGVTPIQADPWGWFWKEHVPKVLQPKAEGMPKGADDFSEEEARAYANAYEERRLLDEAIKRDRERLEQLDGQDAALRSARPPDPAQPDPKLKEPVISPVTGEEL